MTEESMKIKEQRRELQEQLARLEQEEQAENERKLRAENFDRFMGRGEDWIIGKAHCQLDMSGERLPADALPASVSINGNCGSTYPAKAQITSATYVYFHNCIPSSYQHWFEMKMMGITKELMEKILGSPRCTLELMGLQSTSYLSRQFAEEDVPKVKAEIERAQDEILLRFSEKELADVGHLSHGGGILARHLATRQASI